MTAVSKNAHFDGSDNIVNKYNNTVHRSIDLHLILMLNAMKILTKNILNLKLVTMLEFQNTKTSLLKNTLQIGQKKFFLLLKLKIQFLGLI